jgi:hypothetical protein
LRCLIVMDESTLSAAAAQAVNRTRQESAAQPDALSMAGDDHRCLKAEAENSAAPAAPAAAPRHLNGAMTAALSAVAAASALLILRAAKAAEDTAAVPAVTVLRRRAANEPANRASAVMAALRLRIGAIAIALWQKVDALA